MDTKKKFILLAVIISAIMLVMEGCEKNPIEQTSPDPQMYFGQLQLTSEPRMQDPTMPGMVFMLASEDGNYLIKKGDHFVRWHSSTTANEIFDRSIGDTLSLLGCLQHTRDLNGDPIDILTINQE